MSDADSGAETVQIVPRQPELTSVTLSAGTVVLTLRGALPVEQLHRGDRVITRTGGTVLKRVHSRDHKCFWLEFDNPEVVYVLDRQYRVTHAPQDGDGSGATGANPAGPGAACGEDGPPTRKH
ncbi:MAG: Hint domain-containing protein [Paracoccaceae bacterium]|jgi:hypothetical protein